MEQTEMINTKMMTLNTRFRTLNGQKTSSGPLKTECRVWNKACVECEYKIVSFLNRTIESNRIKTS